MHLKCSSPPHVFLALFILPDLTPGSLGSPAVPSFPMSKTVEPFAFFMEPDGSVGIDAYPSSTEGSGPWHHVGHIRSSPDGMIISSLTFEEMNDYNDWEIHRDVDEAVLALLKDCIQSIEGHDSSGADQFDQDRLLSLKRSESLVQEFSFRMKDALILSARQALSGAVKNMLRLSTHDEVTRAVSEALVGSVMDE